jgi:demethylmenaquinone methyltransferase/2-methoxy-6-polyprenyl-1,4-benzoquinol methylase
MSEDYRQQSVSTSEAPQPPGCSPKPHNEASDIKTHFGYQQVPVQEKAQRVAGVFHSVAQKYDLMNDLVSMGVHRLWKRITIELSGVRAGDQVLDLAGGTGDLALHMIKRVGPTGKVVLSDINKSMLDIGRNRLIDKGYPQVEVVQADAQTLPFKEASFDCVTMAFGLRNVTDKEQALREIYRVLKPSGRLLVLEFSKPTFSVLGKVYDFYSFKALPVIGKLITNDAESYRYLAESIRMHPDQETLKAMMMDAGFEQVKYYNMTGGIVALHKGLKI